MALSWISLLYKNLGDIRSAIKYLIQYYAEFPNFPKTTQEIAELYEKVNEYEEAIEWYKKSAKMGWGNACNSLGQLYFDGRPGIPKNKELATEWFIKAAEGGRDSSNGINLIEKHGTLNHNKKPEKIPKKNLC